MNLSIGECLFGRGGRDAARWKGSGWPRAAALLLPLALGLLPSPGTAAPSIALYRGEPSSPSEMQLGGWGSGEAVDTSAEAYSGSNSIRIKTDGYYAGGRIMYPQPVDITPQFTDPHTYLEMVIKFLPGRIRTGPGGTIGGTDYTGGSGYGGPAGYGGPSAYGAPGGAPGGYPGGPGGYPGAPGGVADFGDPTAALLITPDTQRLRVVLVFDGGVAVAEDHPLIRFPTGEPQWVRVPIPFTQFKGAPRMASYRLQEMRVFGDATDTFFIGQIQTVTDSDPISVEPLEEYVVSVYDRIEFVGNAEAGIAGLKYSWDFDKSDGIQEDAVGPRVTHYYRRPSPENKPYIVTLTVSDIGGGKPPVVVETTIEVID